MKFVAQKKQFSLTILVIIAVCVVASFAFSNCSGDGSSSGGTSALSVITLSPATISLAYSATQQFSATGGVGNYSYYIASGIGSIGESTGLYFAPSEAGTAEIEVIDEESNTGTATITVSSSGTVGSGVISFYACPVHASVDCASASECQSTCVGQISGNPTCFYYGEGGAANNAAVEVNCTSVTPTTFYVCPNISSTNCASTTLCESTCLGQIQTGSTCKTYGTNGSATTNDCTAEIEGNTSNIYLCPVAFSDSCDDMSECESTCIGQFTTSPTCYSYNSGGASSGASVFQDCTLIGTSF